MIYVVNYDNSKRKNLYSKLEELDAEFEVGLNETQILKADKIILPETESPFKALKKIHFSNLHSVLRMFTGKILGVGSGFLLMLEKCNEKPCFGFFPFQGKYNERLDLWEVYDNTGSLRTDAIYCDDRFMGVLLMEESTIDEALKKFIEM